MPFTVSATECRHGFWAAAASSDLTAPTSNITGPASGAVLAVNSSTTISGTASDTGGGVVSAIEVSTDGGVTWHPATGSTAWSYTWQPTTTGPANIRSRAIDDSVNVETASAGGNVSVSGGVPTSTPTATPVIPTATPTPTHVPGATATPRPTQ